MQDIAVDLHWRTMLSLMPGVWGYKDINSIFSCASSEYKKMVGIALDEEIAGLSDYDLPLLTVMGARLFREQDQKIIKTGQSIKVIDIYTLENGDWKAYLFIKSPIIRNNQVIGIFFQGQEVTEVISLELGGVLSQNFMQDRTSCFIDKSYFNIKSRNNFSKLTKRETEVMFYLLRGKTLKEIAICLDISTRTVEDYLRKLKEKFNVKNKNELISIGITKGYLNIIPQRFLQTQLLLEIG